MVPFISLQVDRRSSVPLHRQLYDEIRRAVLAGRISAGARLPSTRTLAADLQLSRNTVAGAFDQLLAEGYLEGKIGSGTYVASELPDDLLRAPREPSPRQSGSAGAPRLSERGRMLAETSVSPNRGVDPDRAFSPGIPALDEFPRELWARIVARTVRLCRSELLSYSSPAGYAPLRSAIAEYLRAARGVRCEDEQVIVTSGSQQALDLVARVLLDPGDTAWMEDPGYQGARGAFLAAGVRCAPIPVDDEGLSVASGEARAPGARLAYVSPSHQYPSGVTMSLTRRMALLAWAHRRRAWIVEDDYDSEFRYSGRPLACLQGLDSSGCVIYTGTFSKVLFPALRLGYLVAPAALTGALISARALADRQPPGIEQAVVAEFIAEGHFARHIRRMRSLYAERQSTLLAEIAKQGNGALRVERAGAGMHLVARLPELANDRAVAAIAARAGVTAPPISAYAARRNIPPALVLGYAGYTPRAIAQAVKRLSAAILDL